MGRKYCKKIYPQNFGRNIKINRYFFENDPIEIEGSNVFHFPFLANWNH